MFPKLYLVLSALTLLLAEVTGLRFELPDSERFCFYEDFTGAKSYRLEYSVLKGGNKDVDVSVESPNGKILYKEIKKQQDIHVFETSLGTYKICFSNEFSTFTHKTVYFNLLPVDRETLRVRGGDNRPAVNTMLEQSMENIFQNSRKVIYHQTEYRLNEAKGRFMAESINTRVQWWSIGQTMFIFLTTCGQLFVLRTFFSEKRPQSLDKGRQGNRKI